MGYVLDPSEVRGWIEEINTWLNQLEERYQSGLAVIKEFSESEDLEGKAYNKMKDDFLTYHSLAVHGAAEAKESIQQDLMILDETIGTEYLDGDLLDEQIDNQKKLSRHYDDVLDHLYHLRRIPFFDYYLEPLIENYRNLLEQSEDILCLLKEKLEQLYDIGSNTRFLFDNAYAWFDAVSSAIEDLQVTITGEGNLSNGSWKGLLVPSYEEKVGKLEELEGGREDWIPLLMILNGNTEQEKNLKKWIEIVNNNILNSKNLTQSEKKALLWDQEKISMVWEACEQYYKINDIQVDPRLLIAIVGKEGTGSFNTSSTNLAKDKQNGIEINFKNDLKNALDVVGGKIAAYAYYQEDFSKARENAYNKDLEGISDYDDILHYINWKTPRLQLISQEFSSGVYAGNNTWHKGVRQIYSEIAYEDATHDYTEYAISLEKDKINELIKQNEIIIKQVEFEASKNGQDNYGDSNGEYTIIGTIK